MVQKYTYSILGKGVYIVEYFILFHTDISDFA